MEEVKTEPEKKCVNKPLIVGGVVVVALLVVLVVAGGPATDTELTDTMTSTATTTDIFDMEPIVPEAKVSTEGWKTCRNEEYGYEFKFPAEWHIYGEDALGGPVEGRRHFVRESQECIGTNIYINEHDVLDGNGGLQDTHIFVSVRNIPQLNDTDAGDRPLNILDLYTATKGKKNAVYGVYLVHEMPSLLVVHSRPQSQEPTESWWIDTYIDDWRYSIRPGGLSQDSVRDTLETILSTFRFLDKENTPTEVEV